MPGNGKGHGDPPPRLRLRKLKRFGSSVWEQLKALITKKEEEGRRREHPRSKWHESRKKRKRCRRKSSSAGAPKRSHTEIIGRRPHAGSDARPVELATPRLPWWEIEHWEDVYDETRLWGDLTQEEMQVLKTLLGRS